MGDATPQEGEGVGQIQKTWCLMVNGGLFLSLLDAKSMQLQGDGGLGLGGEGGGGAVRGRSDGSTSPLDGRSYIMETYKIPDEEVSSWICST